MPLFVGQCHWQLFYLRGARSAPRAFFYSVYRIEFSDYFFLVFFMPVDREAAIIRKFIEFYKLANIYLKHFPKDEKYALCTRVRNYAGEVYGYIIEGQKRYHKKTTLTSLDIAHEKLRMELFLAYETGYFRFTDGKTGDTPEQAEARRWMAISKLVDELGRMIGGWIRHEGEAQKEGSKQ